MFCMSIYDSADEDTTKTVQTNHGHSMHLVNCFEIFDLSGYISRDHANQIPTIQYIL